MEREDKREEIIPVVEEKVRIDRREIKTADVRVRKVVREVEEEVDEPVVETRIEVQRVPINEIVDEPRATREEGDTTIISVYEEVLQKRLLLREEVHIRRRKVESRSRKTVVLQKEEVIVDREEFHESDNEF